MSIGCCDPAAWRRRVSRRRLMVGGAGIAALVLNAPPRLRLGAAQEGTPVASPVPAGRVPIRVLEPVVNESFVNPLAEVFGNVEIGRRSYIAGNTILYAAEGRRLSIGDESNVEDNCYLLAEERDVDLQNLVSVGHQAIIENAVIGEFTYFGYRARVRNAVVENGAMVMHGATVEGVTIPPDAVVPLGAQITTQAQADALPTLTETDTEFKRGVLDVHVELVAGYTALFNERGRSALEGVSPNPVTTWNPAPTDPALDEDVVLAELVRVVGDVRIGAESTVGQRTSIRADDGTPIVIGRRARIESRVTFHGIRGSRVDVGENAHVGDGNVIHGPVVIGDNFDSEDDVVVYRATVEDNVRIRAGAIVAGDFTLREGTIVPEQAVVRTQEEANALPRR